MTTGRNSYTYVDNLAAMQIHNMNKYIEYTRAKLQEKGTNTSDHFMKTLEAATIKETCCGVDVHKSFLVATIVKTTGGIEPSYQKKRFSTFNNFILEFKQWLLENNCHDVCMESTGKY